MPATQPWPLQGRVITGTGRASGFTGLDWVQRQLRAALGIEPYPGTLNLELADASAASVRAAVRAAGHVELAAPDASYCNAWCVPVTVAGCVTAAALFPDVPGYPGRQIEIVAAVPLRQHLQLRDGDVVEVAAGDLPPVRAVVFDVDGTLVNSIDGMWLAASRAAALYGFEVPADAVRRSLNFGESLWEAIIPAEARGDRELPAVLHMETMRHWPRVLDESVPVFAGLADTLEELAGAGIRLAIYTGSRGESFLPLQRAGLMGHFDPIVTASEVARAKPHPEGLLRCLEQLACAPGEAVYVGDSVHDIEAGRAAGMLTIGVLTGAADSALLSGAGAHRLAATHASLPGLLLPRAGPAGGPVDGWVRSRRRA